MNAQATNPRNLRNPRNPLHANHNLKPGTKVVSTEDGEPGELLKVCTYRKSGNGAWSYVVQTAYGREVWHAGDLFVPITDPSND